MNSTIIDRCRGWHKPGEAITGDVQLYLDAANEIERLRVLLRRWIDMKLLPETSMLTLQSRAALTNEQKP